MMQGPRRRGAGIAAAVVAVTLMSGSMLGFAVPTGAVQTGAAQTWKIDASPDLVGASVAHLAAVSCVSATFCVAVGSVAPRAVLARTLVEMWDGLRWSHVASPYGDTPVTVPRGVISRAQLNGVSCTSPRNCIAVGEYETKYAGLAVIERWDGSRWSIVPSPTATAVLTGVSCAGARFCMAVGTAVERWNGSRWSIIGGVPASSLSAVSCTSATFCLGVGSNGRRGWAARWNGKRWLHVPIREPDYPDSPNLLGVSCTSPASCVAVGAYLTGFGGAAPPVFGGVAERWDGTRWSFVDTRDQALSGVSCRSGSDCIAVGTNGLVGPLVEQWD